MARIVVDPVTRIGGHLRVEVEMSDGAVSDAWSAATTYRGIERILEGRDARDAWLLAQRVCGTCGTSHAVASVRAVENALGVTIPTNARLIRNLLIGARLVADHATGFYLRHALDWVDVRSALDADASSTSTLARNLSDWPNASPSYFRAVQQRVSTLIQTSQAGPFANGYWGHPAYALSPESNLMVAAHYLEALDFERRMARLQTIIGGKSPHPQTFLVGGMALAPEWGGPDRPVPGDHQWDLDRNTTAALSSEGLSAIGTLIGEAKTFVEQVYVPDVTSIMSDYGAWAGHGTGIGHYLAVGEFPEDNSDRPALLLPRGRIMDRNLGAIVQVGQAGVGESVQHSWYTYDGVDGALRHPSDGLTVPRYAGPKPPYTSLAGSDRYSWLKAPRYEDDPMEVGPLARILVATAAGGNDVQTALSSITARLGSGPDALFGTVGRTVARAAEAKVVVGRLAGWLADLKTNLATGDQAIADITMWDPGTWPREADGWALGESPRGAVGHWVTIRDGRIARYQIVDATTWNASPRDVRGRRGALEAALVGTPVADPDRPLEILRTIHSFDPCLACGVH